MSEPITVSCPACETAFPVDPAKVPPGGVRARCSVCEEIFPVEKPGGDAPEEAPGLALDEPEAPEEPEGEPGGEADAFGDEADPFGTATAEEEEPEATPADAGDGDDLELENDRGFGGSADLSDTAVEPESPVEEEPEASQGDVGFAQPELDVDEPELDEDLPDFEPEAAEADEEPAAPAFGQRTPEQKAQRLARVLVSDMISYNPELHQKALERGTLKDDFEEEIEKSWEEYVEQVGEEIADSTTFWTEALNEILAEGEEIF